MRRLYGGVGEIAGLSIFPGEALGAAAVAITFEVNDHRMAVVFRGPISRFLGFFIIFNGFGIRIGAIVGVTVFADAAITTFAMKYSFEGWLDGCGIILVGLGLTRFDGWFFPNG